MNSDRPPQVCLFVGPSLAADEVRLMFAAVRAEVQVLPPARQGDLLRLLADLPDVIGIVDGYFVHLPSVLHKEILLTLERGARVLGAASLGALRAAKLDVFGMEGIGAIYRLYKRGAIEGDDEVAVLHAGAELEFRSLTTPLVTVRHNLRRALARQIVSGGTAWAVLAAARRLRFTERTYASVLASADPAAAPVGEMAALRRFLSEQAVDPQREDALALVRTAADCRRGAESWRGTRSVSTSATSYMQHHLRAYVGQPTAGSYVPDSLVLSFQKLLSPSYRSLDRGMRFRCLALEEAQHRSLSSTDADLLLARFRRRWRLGSDQRFASWLRERCLTEVEFIEGHRERDLEARFLALYRGLQPGVRSRSAVYRRLAADVAARTGLGEWVLKRPLLIGPGLPWDGPTVRELKLRGEFGPARDLPRLSSGPTTRPPNTIHMSGRSAWSVAGSRAGVPPGGASLRRHSEQRCWSVASPARRSSRRSPAGSTPGSSSVDGPQPSRSSGASQRHRPKLRARKHGCSRNWSENPLLSQAAGATGSTVTRLPNASSRRTSRRSVACRSRSSK